MERIRERRAAREEVVGSEGWTGRVKRERGERGERWSGKESKGTRGGSGGGSGDRASVCRRPGAETVSGSGRRSRGQKRVVGERGFHEARGAPVDGSTAGRAYRSSCLIVCALLSLHLSTCRRRLEGERAPTLAAYPTPKIFYYCRRVVSARTGSDAFVPALYPLVPCFFPGSRL